MFFHVHHCDMYTLMYLWCDRSLVHFSRFVTLIFDDITKGSENCILDGDGQSEHLLSEIVGVQPYKGVRHANMESLYEV
jgi:hypothetical protein